MRKTAEILSLAAIAVLLGVLGCSTSHAADFTTIQGKWKGKEMGANTEGACYLVVSGKNFEFRGANTNEWYKGTLTLKEDKNPRQLVGAITECPAIEYIGKASNGIYKIEKGTLTFTANEPGNPEAPSSFDAVGARRFVFTKE
jgi:uncharacterized protein (TIGR03067 family)